MKIFSNQFALNLKAIEWVDFPSFEILSLSEAVKKISYSPLLFPRQVFFVEGVPGTLFVSEVFDFHTSPKLGEIQAELLIIFRTANDLEKFKEDYLLRFKTMEAAGGLVVNGNEELLLMYRNGAWDLPKGKVEKGETIEVAALREVTEETGLRQVELGEKFLETFHIFPKREFWVMKKTYWFLMMVRAEEKLIPQEEEGITGLEWRKMRELFDLTPDTFPLIMDLIRRISLKFHSK